MEDVPEDKIVSIWYSTVLGTWLLETDKQYGPKAVRCLSFELAVDLAKRQGKTHRLHDEDVTKLVPL